MSFNGWMLPDEERARVLGHFPPRYDAVKCSHITLSIDDKVLPQDAEVTVVGYADDGVGVEALVCAVNGESQRPDGSFYHLTLSHAVGRAAKEANDVVKAGWEPVEPVEVQTRAFLCRGGNYITTPLTKS